jgi:DNA polymerase alpha subunit A
MFFQELVSLIVALTNTAEGRETDIEVDIPSVYKEFDALRKKHKIKTFSSKVVSRKYAFELDDIPAESDYLKVVYPFSEPELPLDCRGATFSHVFGAKTRALELFLLKRKLMGPTWIKIVNPTLSNDKVSYTKTDLMVQS